MATGERLTVTYSHPPSGPLKVDVYCYVPAVDPIDPSPNLDRLPFLLFLHGGHFFTGSKRDVPPWLASLARSLGCPLLCADYRLAPHAGPAHAVEDLQQLWHFLQHDLPWIIACSGNGAEVESGTEALGANFIDLQRRGGIDMAKGVLVGLGSGGYLAAMGGGFLSPPPIALVLGYATLQIESSSSRSGDGRREADAVANTAHSGLSSTLQDLLRPADIGNDRLAKSAAPDMPIFMRKAPYASTMREAAGMDVGESWAGQEESLRRAGLVDYLVDTQQWSALLHRASPGLISPSDMLVSPARTNWPYPPTIAYHGLQDTMVSAQVSQQFIESIRAAEPVAAAVDALANGTASRSASSSSSSAAAAPSADPARGDRSADRGTPENSLAFQAEDDSLNITSRYIYLGIRGPGAGHGFDALLPRLLSAGAPAKNATKIMSDRYRAGMIHIEHFLRHWLAEGSAVIAAKGSTPAGRTAEGRPEGGREDDKNRMQSHRTSPSNPASSSDGRGARIKLPRGGPRL